MIFGLIVVALLLSPAVVGYLYARPKLNPTIQKRLRSHGKYELKTFAMWDPSRGPTARLIGRARGTYWVDETGLVHLHYRPRLGAEREIIGPLPPGATGGDLPAVVLGGYGLAAFAGYVIGYAFGPQDQRGEVAVFSAAGGIAAVYVVASIARVGSRRRRRGRDTSKSQ